MYTDAVISVDAAGNTAASEVKRFLRADLSVECDTGDHAAYAPLGLGMLFVYAIGIPLVGWLLLRRHIRTILYVIELPCAAHHDKVGRQPYNSTRI